MKAAMKNAFKDLAEGDFEDGLCKLNQNDKWRDHNDSLDGPFYLGFPCFPGWGESLLAASLLKRHAANSRKRINVSAQEKACSILKQDHAFCVRPAENIDQARSCGSRSPLAILRHALTGGLLDLPFVKIDTGTIYPQTSRSERRIGIAWASMQKNREPICDKSIPLEEFLSILGDDDAEVISFQRDLDEDNCKKLRDQYRGRCSILSNNELDEMDQSAIAGKIHGLDCMVTISTTTAHIAACLGVPVVLLAAKRPWHQWFWRAQAEHDKCFYPNLDVILGSAPDEPGHWWEKCLEPAKSTFLTKLGRHP